MAVNHNKPQKGKEIVVQNITIKATNRKTQDISNWRSAIKQFENRDNPVRTALYDLLTDINLDGHVEAVTAKRTEAVTNKELIFVKDGVEDLEINKLLNSPSMISILKDLHHAKYWGYTLLQFNNINFDEDQEQYVIDYDLIPRKHVHPERGFECISKEQNQITKDVLFTEPPLSKYMIWAGDPYDFGLLTKAAQYVIYKRGDFGDWAQFAEMFGMPFREGRYDDFDDKTRIALEQMMEAYGSASYAILPKGADFKLHDAVKGTAGELYKELKNACNDEISKIFLGNTLTTEQGENGARSLGEVHMEVERNKASADERFILSILNGKMKAILKLFGFNVQGGSIWYRSPDANWEALGKKWTVLNSMADRLPIDDDYFYEEFDVPKPKNYKVLKQALDANKLTGLNGLNKGLNTEQTALQNSLNEHKSLLQNIKDFFV